MSATQPDKPLAPPRPKRRRSTRLQRKQTRLAWLMLTPALVVMALVAFYPLGQTVYDSFTDRQFLGGLEPTRWVGLDNYRDLIHDTIFRDAVVVTVKFTVITVSIELVLGMIIALVVNSGFKGRGVMRAVMLVPWAIPTVVAAAMWKWMYDDVFGVVNDSLVRLHVIDSPVAWISEQPLASVAAVDIWKTTPFVALLLLAGLQVIPHELYEAANVDGASKWHQFWRITLPLLVPAILVTLIFRTLDALRVFDVFYVFFGSRVDTQTMAIYNQNTIVAFGDVGYGAAISVGDFPDHRPLRRHLRDVHAGATAMSVARLAPVGETMLAPPLAAPLLRLVPRHAAARPPLPSASKFPPWQLRCRLLGFEAPHTPSTRS